MNLLIMGAPGCGKGTMSRYITNDYPVVHISTGDMLREAVSNLTPIGKRAKEYMDSGALVPDEVIHDLIVERFAQDDIKQGFLFDGYPRTIEQAYDLENILKKYNLKIDAVLNIEVEEDILIKRITGRRCCPNCGNIYNNYFKPTKVLDVCDNCGSTLTIRKDDNSESLNVRLEAYRKNSEPIVAYYQKAGLFHNFKGSNARDDVYGEIKKVLEAC